MWTFARRLARILLGAVVVVVLLVGVVVVASRTATVRDLVRARLVAVLAAATDAHVRIGGVAGTLGSDLVLEDVRLVVEGRTVVRVPRIEVVYAVLPLLWRTVRLSRVTVHAPRVRAVRDAAGWRLPRPRGGDGGAPTTIAVERLVVEDGRIAVALLDVAPIRRVAATALALEATARVGAAGPRLELTSVRFVPRGIALSPVSASARIAAAGGAVRISGLELATARSRVAAAGVLAPGRRVDLRARLSPLAAADVQAVAPGTRLAADVRARARARGPWRAIAAVARADLAPGGTLVARSDVDAGARPARWAARARFSRLDPGAAVRGLPHASMNGELRARGSRLDPRSAFTYRLVLAATDVAGQRIDRFALGGHATHAVHRVHGEGHAPLGEAVFHARLALGALPAYRLAARYTVARLDALVPSAPGWATGRVRANGQGLDAERRLARVDLALSGGAVHGVPIDQGAARVRVDGRRVEVETLALRGVDVALDGSGALDLERRTVACELTARADLGAVGRRLGRRLEGRAAVSATASGPLEGFAVNARATVDGPAYASASADAIVARAELAGLGGAAGNGRVHVDAPGLRLRPGAPWTARADVDWRRAGGEDRARLTAAAADQAAHGQEIAVTLVRAGERVRGEVETLTVTAPDGSPWRLATPARFTLDSALATEGLVLRAGSQRIALAGRLGLRGASDASLTLDGIALAPLCAMGGAPPCGGELSGKLALAGTADAPVMTLTARARDLQVATVAYGILDLDARYAARAVRLHSTLRHPRAGEVTVDGEVPVDLAWVGPRAELADAPVALTARADRLDLTVLQALAPRTLRSAAGRLSLQLNVSGPRSAPRTEGQLALDDGRVELIAAGVPYEDIRARVTAQGTHFDVVELHARAGEGTADVGGSADVAAGGASTVQLGVRLHDFLAVQRQAYEAAVSGNLTVQGALARPEVTGALAVEHALVRPAALPAAGPSIPRDRTITVVGLPEEVAEEAPPPPGSGLGGPLRIAVKVEVARNAWIRRSDANIELGGSLEITKAPFEPVRIVGQIRLLRGWYAFQGRRFTIDQGTITFTGATPPKPVFDITAVHRTPEYRIEVHITGSADKPTLALSSDPPLEQADVLSVLLFGKPANQLGRGQSVALQEQALQLAAGYVVPELRTSVMDALGLDTLEVEMPQGTEAGRVSAGRYVAQDVFFSLGQEFGTRNAQVVGVEYSIGRNVSVRASTSTRGDSAVDLFWHYRY